MSRENHARTVFSAIIGLCIESTQEAMVALSRVREWLGQLAEASRKIDLEKQLDLHTFINKLAADILSLKTAERVFSHLPSVLPANQAILLIQIRTCCGQVKSVPDEYPRQGDSTYASNMIAWVHEIVCGLYRRTGDANIMKEGTNFLDKWAITLERIDEILERCDRLQVYINSCVVLDDVSKLNAKFLAAIEFSGGPMG